MIPATRRLAAILAADVVGFSKLIGEDEARTLSALREIRREIVNPLLTEHGGRIFKLMGDGMLAEFPSAVQALRAAIGMQERMRARNAGLPGEQRIEVRIGVHQGDVVVEGSDLLGDGVNIAARLEGLAEAGGICISGRVHEDAAGKIPIHDQDMGEQTLKNIARPIRAYRILPPSEHSPSKAATDRPNLPLPDRPSLAVLPFQNMSGDPEQEYFAEGIVEDIITGLSRVRAFFVIARSSSFTYKGKSVDVKQVGRELGVRYVLEGSVRKAGGRLRITGQLVEAESGTHLWADRYEGDLNDIFALQDSITRSVVGTVAPKLEQAEIKRAFRKRTEDLSAYDLVLRAIQGYWMTTPEKNAEALNLLHKAIEVDPNYAYAYAWVALCILVRKNSAWPPWHPDQDQLCVRFAREAIKLDMNDPTVLWISGGALGSVNRETQYAKDLIDRSLAIDPNSAHAWAMKGWVNLWLGRGDDGIAAFESAMRLSPFDPWMGMFIDGIGECHNVTKRHTEAVEWLMRAMRENPNPLPTTRRALAVAYAYLGRLEEARELVRELLETNPSFTVSKWLQITPSRVPAYFAEGLRLAGFPE